jgi:ribose/xylose/arabinose/galactoside ABC-type transport system permease subunit
MKSLNASGQATVTTLVAGVLVCMLVGAFIGTINALLINYARLVPSSSPRSSP